MKWSFNRLKDESSIETEVIEWKRASEMPIKAKNYSPYKIYGLPETLEF